MVIHQAQKHSNKVGHALAPCLEDGAVFLGFTRKLPVIPGSTALQYYSLLQSDFFPSLKGSLQLSGIVLSKQSYVWLKADSYLVSITVAKRANGLRHGITHHP